MSLFYVLYHCLFPPVSDNIDVVNKNSIKKTTKHDL